jgi:hypothetical protein
LSSGRPAIAAGQRSARRPLQATAEVFAADDPIALCDGTLLQIVAEQEFLPQPLPTVRLSREPLIPGVGRQQRVGLAQGVGPATGPTVRPRRCRQTGHQGVPLDVTAATEEIPFRLDSRAFEAALKDVADETVPPLHLADVRYQQAGHYPGELVRLRLQSK